MAKGRINIVIAGDASQLNKAMAQSERRMRKFGRNLQSIGDTVFRSIGVPFIAAGAAGVKAAVDFESSMSKIQGLVGITGDEFKKLEDAALSVGPTFGKSAQEAADALFFITSAGMSGNDAIEMLNATMKASAAGLGETKILADLATGVLDIYGKENISAAEATDALTTAIKLGKLETETLSDAFGRALPVANNLGVSVQDLGAAFAVMSRGQVRADEASTQLRGLFISLLKPTNDMEKAMKQAGLTVEQVRQTLREKGLLATLKLMKESMDANGVAAADMFSNVRALNGFLVLTKKLGQETEEIFQGMADSAGNTDKAFAAAAETTQFKFNQALAQLNAAAIKLGRDLIPMVTDVVESIQKAVHWFTSLDDSTRKLIVSVLKWTTILSAGASVVGRVVVSVANLSRALRGLGLARAIAGFAGLAKTGTTANIAIRMLGIGLKSLVAPVLAASIALESLESMFNKMSAGQQAMTGPVNALMKGYKWLKDAIFGTEEATEDLSDTTKELTDDQKALYADAQSQLDKWKLEEFLKNVTGGFDDLSGSVSATQEALDNLNNELKFLEAKEDLFGKTLTVEKINAVEAAIDEMLKETLDPFDEKILKLKRDLEALYAAAMPKQDPLQKIQSGSERFGTPDSIESETLKKERSADSIKSLLGIDLIGMSEHLREPVEGINNVEEAFNSAAQAGQQFGNMLMDAFGSSATAAEAMGKILLKVASEVVLGNLMTALSGWINKTFQTLGPWGVPLAAAGFGVITALMGRAKGFKSGVPQMAEGGILTGPTMLQAGEYPGARVNPEVIAPLDKLKSMLGGNTVNVTGEFRVRGTDLIVTLERANRIKQNERGYGLNG